MENAEQIKADKEAVRETYLHEKELDELKALVYKRNEITTSFAKHLILVASGSLSIIISFHKTTSSSCSTDIYFATLFLIAFGIVVLAISLYGDIRQMRIASEENWKYIQKRYWNKDKTASPYSGQMHKFFIWCERIGYVSLLLAVVSFLILARLEG